MISVTSSTTPGMVVNSCSTPSIRIPVMAKPSSEERSTPAQGIADGKPVPLFERTKLESAFIVLGVDHHHFVRLLKV